ncbi:MULTISPECIES: hypothetical protein [unclassified Alteromonas]|uniref:hypothetical protein n=1 Tax=unclassified Alteromonas TaxID=2614992 RepID=UPI000509621D|nr:MULTISPECIES: hypothetical protein [unclassified Alteromonas]
MKSWNELTNLQRAIIGISMVVAAALLPEIAFLVQLGGVEVAFALVFASLAPLISWVAIKYKAIKECLQTSVIAFKLSASAKPSVFFVQASFCAIALLFTSSGLWAFYFFMPGMLLNGVLA